jgi:hypothetical protein
LVDPGTPRSALVLVQPLNFGLRLHEGISPHVSRSLSKHEGESSAEVCDGPSRTRAISQSQLTTDHDYAVSTREYQLDQSSPLPASAAPGSVLEMQKQKHPTDLQILTGNEPEGARFAVPERLSCA